jgi:branched-chain amino acid transport system substrate-binding protein
MTHDRNPHHGGRRTFLSALGALAGATAFPAIVRAQPPIRLGLMLPYTGTYAQLGTAIENGIRLAAVSAAARSGSSRSTTNPTRQRRPTTPTAW